MKNIIKFLQEVNKLKRIKRTGWVETGVKDPESVADHSFRLALMSMLLAPRGLDKDRMVKMAIVHDLAESVVGDIRTHPDDTEEFRQKKHEKERQAMDTLMKKLNGKLASEVRELWDEYEEKKTPEAKFVKQLDKLEMVFQALEYEDKTDESLDIFWNMNGLNITNPKLLEIYEELKKQR